MYYRVYIDLVGHYRWKLVSANNRIIAESAERYWNRLDCEAGIKLVKSSTQAPIEEV